MESKNDINNKKINIEYDKQISIKDNKKLYSLYKLAIFIGVILFALNIALFIYFVLYKIGSFENFILFIMLSSLAEIVLEGKFIGGLAVTVMIPYVISYILYFLSSILYFISMLKFKTIFLEENLKYKKSTIFNRSFNFLIASLVLSLYIDIITHSFNNEDALFTYNFNILSMLSFYILYIAYGLRYKYEHKEYQKFFPFLFIIFTLILIYHIIFMINHPHIQYLY